MWHSATRPIRRGSRLAADEETLFSGEFWTGVKAKDLGLIDGLGDLKSVMRQKFGDKVRLKVSEPSRGWLRRRMGMGSPETPAVSDNWASSLIDAVETRALWSRFGQ